jgi:hypothetical protein
MGGGCRAVGGCALVVLALCPATRVEGQPQAPTLADVLSAAASYVADYEKQMSVIVSEERYEQQILGPAASAQRSLRELRSDVLVVADEKWGWVGFRDVFEVDGSPVRDREDRLATLFLKPTADTLLRARRIMDEGARFNLDVRGREINRNINLPMVALKFLDARAQPRSTFRIDGTKSLGPDRFTILKFQEHARPRMIASIDDSAASGLFWIDAPTGRVMHSELRVETRVGGMIVTALVAADYAFQAKVALWVPVAMTERYTIGTSGIIQGHAAYSNFRRFNVETTTDIK